MCCFSIHARYLYDCEISGNEPYNCSILVASTILRLIVFEHKFLEVGLSSKPVFP